MQKISLFFADQPECWPIARRAVGSLFDVTFCSSFKDAKSFLNSSETAKHVDLIACGVHFDEGKMHDLLHFVKANAVTEPIPFLCVKLRNGKLTPFMLKGIRTSSEILGAQGFVHLPDLISEHNESIAFGILSSRLNDLFIQRARLHCISGVS